VASTGSIAVTLIWGVFISGVVILIVAVVIAVPAYAVISIASGVFVIGALLSLLTTAPGHALWPAVPGVRRSLLRLKMLLHGLLCGCGECCLGLRMGGYGPTERIPPAHDAYCAASHLHAAQGPMRFACPTPALSFQG
jgi:hypothetical protein